MGRKAQVALGLCFLAAICVWGAYRAGLRFTLVRPTSSASPTAPAAPVIAPVASSIPVEPPKVIESPFPPSDPNLNDSDPDTFVALRYDKTHVLFRLGESGDFTLEDPEQEKMFHQLAPPVAEYGAQPSELEPAVFESVKQHYEPVHVGEQWQLEVLAGGRVPVTIQKPIEMSWGCANNSYTAGFIAEVAPEFQAAFSALPQKYFLVHKAAAITGSQVSDKLARTGELADWNPTPEMRKEIETFIAVRIRGEIASKTNAWWAKASGSGQNPGMKRRSELWEQFVARTNAGEGKLTYDARAFLLSPDGVPRLYVRAMWKIGEDRAFLMSRWVRMDPAITIEFEKQDGTETMWQEKNAGESVPLEISSLPSVLNAFDRADGYADVLLFSPGYEGYSIGLYRYSDEGLIATKISIGDGC